jgi:hypothetical protein
MRKCICGISAQCCFTCAICDIVSHVPNEADVSRAFFVDRDRPPRFPCSGTLFPLKTKKVGNNGIETTPTWRTNRCPTALCLEIQTLDTYLKLPLSSLLRLFFFIPKGAKKIAGRGSPSGWTPTMLLCPSGS